MPSGVQLWDEFGQLMVDLTDRLTQYSGAVSVTAGTSGGVTVPGTGQGNLPWASFVPVGLGANEVIYTLPVFTISETGISWSSEPAYQGLPAYGGTLYYGRY